MASSLVRGSSVAHYRIVSTIGAGGMGEVYEARDEHLDRAVALKVLPPDLVQNEDRVRRFVQEAKSASGLNHPNIVTIYDIGHTEPSSSPDAAAEERAKPVHFIAMELVRGRTLRDKIHHESVPLKDLLRWLAQAAEGMAKAHAAGIIHRDLKPENIMISNDGFAKILDFGLAKLTERRISGEGAASVAATDVRQKTREGAVLGTVGYMSPEQVQGKVVDERSDIFSFGCLLYEVATRRRPFDADSDIETMHQIIAAQPPPVSELNPEAPSELRKLIRRCLAKDPEKRYQSMKDLSLELYDLVEEFDQLSVSAASRSSGSSDSVSPVTARRPWVIPASIILAGIAIGAGIYLATKRGEVEKPASRSTAITATFTQLTDLAGRERSPSISPDGVFVAFSAGASAESYQSDIFLQRIGGRNPINLTKDSPVDDDMPAFSPDGQWIAFRSERSGGGIYVMGATGESVRRIADFGFNPSWSPDGKKVVVSTETGHNPRGRTTIASLWTIEVQGGEKKKIFDGDAVQPQWSPDGKWIAFWSLPVPQKGQRDISVVPAAGGKRIAITDDPPLDWSPAWAPDGRALYFASDRGGSMNLWRVPIDPGTGAPAGDAQAVTTPSAWSGEIAVARTTGKVVFASQSGEINIHRVAFDADKGTAAPSDLPVTTGSTLFLEVDASPDGSEVVTRSWSGNEDVILVRTDGSGMRRITDDPHKDRAPRWSPDGKRLTFYSDRSGRYEIWVIDPDGSNMRQVTKTEGRSLWFPAWAPDGSKIIASNEQGPRVIDLPRPWPITQTEALPAVGPERSFEAADWSPDGRFLVGFVREKGLDVPGVWVYSFETRTYEQVTEKGFGYQARAAWLADSRRFIFADQDTLWLSDRISRETKAAFRAPGFYLQTPRVSRDQKSIFYTKGRNEGDIWMATLE